MIDYCSETANTTYNVLREESPTNAFASIVLILFSANDLENIKILDYTESDRTTGILSNTHNSIRLVKFWNRPFGRKLTLPCDSLLDNKTVNNLVIKKFS